VIASVAEAGERNASRSGAARVPDASFARVCAAFEPPSPEAVSLGSGLAPAEAWRRVFHAWGAAEEAPETEEAARVRVEGARTETLASRAHAADLRTRAALSAAVAAAGDKEERGRVAKRLNVARRELLTGLKAARSEAEATKLEEGFLELCTERTYKCGS